MYAHPVCFEVKTGKKTEVTVDGSESTTISTQAKTIEQFKIKLHMSILSQLLDHHHTAFKDGLMYPGFHFT